MDMRNQVYEESKLFVPVYIYTLFHNEGKWCIKRSVKYLPLHENDINFLSFSFVSGVGSFTIVDGNKIKGEDVGNK